MKTESGLRDGSTAKNLGLNPGFRERDLMEQVEPNLQSGETLYWASRPSLYVTKKHAMMVAVTGSVIALIGIGISVGLMFAKDVKMPFTLIPLLFAFVGVLVAVFGPILKMRQARHGWYALTNKRGIVFEVYPIGRKGKVTNYGPSKLQNMKLMKIVFAQGSRLAGVQNHGDHNDNVHHKPQDRSNIVRYLDFANLLRIPEH